MIRFPLSAAPAAPDAGTLHRLGVSLLAQGRRSGTRIAQAWSKAARLAGGVA